MIDIHCHILPMVDDGAQSVDQAIQMLIDAYSDNTDKIVLTPHFAFSYGFINPYEKIHSLFHDLKYIVDDERIPIDMYLGCEYLFDSINTYKNHIHEITKMNHTDYLLMEFYFDVDGDFIIDAIDCVINSGYIPIIAHPERYESIQVSHSLARHMIDHGSLLQMNKGSIFNQYGRNAGKCVLDMLDHHYISFMGSDAHNTTSRNSLMYDDYLYVCDYYGEDYANRIFEINPERMLSNSDIRKKGNQ
ncbi:MAG: hypothetical protein LUF02_01450 [Erysipelotrichaceae bacterium]|nr:hypothetical protein [Erysipelotrichaceae bacterium]